MKYQGVKKAFFLQELAGVSLATRKDTKRPISDKKKFGNHSYDFDAAWLKGISGVSKWALFGMWQQSLFLLFFVPMCGRVRLLVGKLLSIFFGNCNDPHLSPRGGGGAARKVSLEAHLHHHTFVQFSQIQCLSGRLIREAGAREPSKGRIRKKFQSLSLSLSFDPPPQTSTAVPSRSESLLGRMRRGYTAGGPNRDQKEKRETRHDQVYSVSQSLFSSRHIKRNGAELPFLLNSEEKISKKKNIFS